MLMSCWLCFYLTLSIFLKEGFIVIFMLLSRVRVVKSEDDVLVVCPTILTEDGMQAQHLGATLALYRLVKGQVSLGLDASGASLL